MDIFIRYNSVQVFAQHSCNVLSPTGWLCGGKQIACVQSLSNGGRCSEEVGGEGGFFVSRVVKQRPDTVADTKRENICDHLVAA